MKFHFNRRAGWYILQAYLPTCKHRLRLLTEDMRVESCRPHNLHLLDLVCFGYKRDSRSHDAWRQFAAR